jgi:hypothetical protein
MNNVAVYGSIRKGIQMYINMFLIKVNGCIPELKMKRKGEKARNWVRKLDRQLDICARKEKSSKL